VTEGLSERQRAKRAQITDAAHRLFLANGFAGTSIDSIVAEAGVSKQTLYTYFPTKIELLAAVLYGGISDISLPGGEPIALTNRDDLRRTLLGFSVQITRNLLDPEAIALVRLVLGEVFRVVELRKVFRDALPGQLLAQVQAILMCAAGMGLIRLSDPDLAARMFVGPLMTYVALDGFLSAEPANPPSVRQLEKLVDAFLTLVEA
jgi:TetR/AcrR family transcriptional repressor of mexJK operon